MAGSNHRNILLKRFLKRLDTENFCLMYEVSSPEMTCSNDDAHNFTGATPSVRAIERKPIFSILKYPANTNMGKLTDKAFTNERGSMK